MAEILPSRRKTLFNQSINHNIKVNTVFVIGCRELQISTSIIEITKTLTENTKILPKTPLNVQNHRHILKIYVYCVNKCNNFYYCQ